MLAASWRHEELDGLERGLDHLERGASRVLAQCVPFARGARDWANSPVRPHGVVSRAQNGVVSRAQNGVVGWQNTTPQRGRETRPRCAKRAPAADTQGTPNAPSPRHQSTTRGIEGTGSSARPTTQTQICSCPNYAADDTRSVIRDATKKVKGCADLHTIYTDTTHNSAVASRTGRPYCGRPKSRHEVLR